MASSKTALSPTAVKDINADIGRTGAPSNTVAAATDLEHRENISSPHELTDWVDSLIDSLQNKFDGMGRGMDQRSECRPCPPPFSVDSTLDLVQMT